jgi:exo-beta-1,3-glucanase (GH17 family)
VRYLLAGEHHAENGAGWIDGIYAAVPDIGSYFDGVAVHPYSGARSPGYYTPPYTDWQFRRIEQIRATLVAHGAAGKHLWLTEIGWSTCPGGSPYECVTEQQQADYIQQAFDMVRASYGDWVDAVFVYSFRSWEASPTNKEDWFGIVHLDGTRKPAYDVLRALTGGP